MRAAAMKSARRKLWRDEDGASAVEFAIVASVLITFCMGILHLGWALQIRNELAKAADEAVRFVALYPESDDTEFENEAKDALAGYAEDRLQVDAGAMTVGTTDFRTLTVEYDMAVWIPGFSQNALTLSVSRRTPAL